MCTAVAWPTATGYAFAFNRDELLSRPEALPPQQRGAYMAPIDPEGGGSWLATNVHGLTLAALNIYEAARHEPEPPVRSRGLLVTDLADAATLAELAERVAQYRHLHHTRPFHLLALALPHQAVDLRWDGETLTTTAATLPLLRVSAAIDAPAVRQARAEEYAELLVALPTAVDIATTLRSWFASHALNGASRGVCMHREPFAATVSHTQVFVAAGDTQMRYLAGPPCQDVACHVAHLPRP